MRKGEGEGQDYLQRGARSLAPATLHPDAKLSNCTESVDSVHPLIVSESAQIGLILVETLSELQISQYRFSCGATTITHTRTRGQYDRYHTLGHGYWL